MHAFLRTDDLKNSEHRVRDAQLRLTVEMLEHRTGLPAHLQAVLSGFVEEIKQRVFLPIVHARDADEAAEVARRSIDAFAVLWPGVLAAVIPWLAEKADHLSSFLSDVGDIDPWSDEEVQGRLGLMACANFAAAQTARLALAKLVVAMPGVVQQVDEHQLIGCCLVADFALMFGIITARTGTDTRPAEGVTAWMAVTAFDAAREAYGIVAVKQFSDEHEAPANPAG